jgi:hypothetical protein
MRHLFLNVMRRRSKKRQSVPMPAADAARLQFLLKLDERDIRGLGDLAKEESRFGFDTARPAVAALRLRREVAYLPQTASPPARARRAHPVPFRRLAAGQPPINSLNDTLPKIVRKGFGHACWPPAPACSLNQTNADSGIPFDSIGSENALAMKIS